jgi:hypothetical protein
MPYQIFTLWLHPSKEEMENLNSFLRGHRIVQVSRQFVDGGAHQTPCWSFCVEYADGRPLCQESCRVGLKWT